MATSTAVLVGPAPDPPLEAPVLAHAAGARRILVATDDGRSGVCTLARATAIRLAAAVGAEVVLYDRSAESRFVDPYPEGGYVPGVEGRPHETLLGAQSLLALGRSYLAAQTREAAAAGVLGRAWLPRQRGSRGMRECIDRFGIDLVVLPDALGRPSAVGRLRGQPMADLDVLLSVPTLLVAEDGTVRRAGTWRVERGASALRFTARQFRVMPVSGRFEDFTVDLDYEESSPEESFVDTTIAAGTIRTGLGVRDRQLKSARFLDAARHPRIRFRSTSIERMGSGFLIKGDLTIRDLTRSVTLDAGLEQAPSDAAGRRRVHFRGRTTIRWRDWGLAGVGFVGPTLTIEVDVAATELEAIPPGGAIGRGRYHDERGTVPAAIERERH